VDALRGGGGVSGDDVCAAAGGGSGEGERERFCAADAEFGARVLFEDGVG